MFHRIPAELIRATELGEHRVEFFYELQGRRNSFDKIVFSLYDVVADRGYNPANNRNSDNCVYKQAAKVAEWMYEQRYVLTEFDSSQAKLKTCYSLEVNSEKIEYSRYGVISPKEMEVFKGEPNVINCLALIRLYSNKEGKFITYRQSMATMLGISLGAINRVIKILVEANCITLHRGPDKKTLIKDITKGAYYYYVRQADIS